MKKEEAEKLVCPFMSSQQFVYVPLADGRLAEIREDRVEELHQACITTKCMAWVEIFEEFKKDRKWSTTDKEVFIKYHEDGDMIYKNKTSDEGYCRRLK